MKIFKNMKRMEKLFFFFLKQRKKKYMYKYIYEIA